VREEIMAHVLFHVSDVEMLNEAQIEISRNCTVFLLQFVFISSTINYVETITQ
jgi:hypothetical protein